MHENRLEQAAWRLLHDRKRVFPAAALPAQSLATAGSPHPGAKALFSQLLNPTDFTGIVHTRIPLACLFFKVGILPEPAYSCQSACRRLEARPPSGVA